MVKRLTAVGMAVLFCVFLFKAPAVFGQAVFGSIIGTVTDPQGNAVVGAKVTVTSVTKSFTYDTTTNESGNYSVTHLIPDTYKVHVEATGFKALDVPSVSVSADTAANVNAELQLGAVTQTVEVTSAVPQLQTDRADVDIQFSQKYVEDLPVLNRNFTNFELLSPGAQKLVGWSHAATENPQGGGQIFVNGQHFSGTNFELDGTDNQDPILGIIVVNPNLDAIAETKIALQDYDAESGKAVAGTIGVQIKSGSNEFHGTGFYYYRNSDQQARDPFTNKPGVPLAPATWKQFGGSVGGPIIKDKLFFFGDYQGTKQIQGITNLYTTPTAEVIKTCNPATNTTGFCDLSEYLNAYGPPVNGVASGQIYDPATGNAADGSGRTAFANNMIPIGRISAGMGKLLAEFPTPTASGVNNNFVSTGNGPYNQYSFDTRIDYNAPHNYQVFGRFSLDYFSLSGLGGLGALGGVGFGPGGLNGSSINHDYSLASGFTKAFGANWLTDFRLGWFQYNPMTHYSDESQSPMDGFNFPGLNSGPGIQGPPTTGGLSGFQFSGNGSLSAFGDGLNIGRCNCPLTERERQIQFVNNWTRIRGNHTFKFGVDIRYATNLRIPSDSSRTGILNFDAGDTSLLGNNGLGLATMLLGDVTSFQRFVSPPNVQAIGHQWREFSYGQDTWRVTPKFTMTLGVRWEIYNPEAVTAKGNAGFADLNNGTLLVAGYGGVSNNGGVANTFKAFAPRVSFAYQLDSKTVLRIGYGRGFDIGVFGSNFGHAVTQNLPILASQSLADSNINPGFTDNRSAVFNLLNGPPAYPFAGLINDLNTNGYLPLLGPDGTAATYIRPRVQRLPTIDQWNATVQRQITSTLNITVSYIGNKGTHVFAGTGPSYGLNDPAIGTGTNPVVCTAVAPVTCSLNGFNPSIPANKRREFFLNGVYSFPYTGTGYTPCCSGGVGNYFGNDANNNYNALQIKAEKRTSYGLQFLAHYTFSRAYAYDSNYYDVNKFYAYGPNPDNRNHEFVASTIYELPIGKGKRFMSDASRAMDLAIGGWQVSNTLTWGGGLPWTPSIGECGAISDAGPCRPNAIGGQKLQTGTRTVGGAMYWFIPAAPLSYGSQVSQANAGVDSCTFARPTSGPFSLPACGQIGNAGFDSYRGPHVFYDDMSLSKTFNITERYKAQFRFDAYNVFNHPVLAFNGNQGNTCVDCGGTAGQITDIEGDNSPGSPTGMRQLQFGFRFIF
ncbi:MAG TPA: carboxypeptidase regulatory-like domain-containing protein [Candidatus Solibacter sp.]|nr:carboxypeptidase regulatory-like domain-containing protein [Candidatus Solibacter sp.]